MITKSTLSLTVTTSRGPATSSEEPWGERLFQVTAPNGVVVQLVEWARL
ncbi:hypothetical protein ACQPZF_12660 [Actinosynnema sp. CS-041913]